MDHAKALRRKGRKDRLRWDNFAPLREPLEHTQTVHRLRDFADQLVIYATRYACRQCRTRSLVHYFLIRPSAGRAMETTQPIFPSLLGGLLL